MLTQPTINKLIGMRMRGMAEAFREQQESPDCSGSVSRNASACSSTGSGTGGRTERWRGGLRIGRLQGSACIEDIDYRTPRGLDRQSSDP